MIEWKDVLTRNPIYLNLGGGRCCHPSPRYKNYISIDQKKRSGWAIVHNLLEPIPLRDGSVDRILTEDFIEHIAISDINKLVKECYRLLKPGGILRIGAPDYNNPKDQICLAKGKDPQFPGHVTLTHFGLLYDIVHQSPFEAHEFYHYWQVGRYHWKPIDYSQGLIQRTPENYYRIYMRSLRHIYHELLHQWNMRINRNPVDRLEGLQTIRFGHPFYTTPIVVDLWKKGQ